MNGKLWVDEFVTHHRDLKEINEGFDDMHVSRLCMYRLATHNMLIFHGLFAMPVWKLYPMCCRYDQDLKRSRS
jgi:hypothetical protein